MASKRPTVDLAALRPSVSLRFLYNTPPGRLLLKALTRPNLSKLVGRVLSSSFSKAFIPRFIRKNHIDVDRYDLSGVRSYNDFFSRPLKPSALQVEGGLISPCDAKLTAYPITKDALFTIKGSVYDLREILGGDDALAETFQGGVCLIFRLSVDNYHRYCYFDDCEELRWRFIPGVLHTVQPIAFHHYNIYHRNCREYTVLDTAHFGTAVQLEVGALCVGKIENYHQSGPHKRGQEKGKFLFGGSTVVVLLREGAAQIDPEILENTRKGLETVVTMGEQIGAAASQP